MGCTNKNRAVAVAVSLEKAESTALGATPGLRPDFVAIVAKTGLKASTGQLTMDRARRHLTEIYRLY